MAAPNKPLTIDRGVFRVIVVPDGAAFLLDALDGLHTAGYGVLCVMPRDRVGGFYVVGSKSLAMAEFLSAEPAGEFPH